MWLISEDVNSTQKELREKLGEFIRKKFNATCKVSAFKRKTTGGNEIVTIKLTPKDPNMAYYVLQFRRPVTQEPAIEPMIIDAATEAQMDAMMRDAATDDDFSTEPLQTIDEVLAMLRAHRLAPSVSYGHVYDYTPWPMTVEWEEGLYALVCLCRIMTVMRIILSALAF
eukprot:GHVS01061297.1.p1 GENE.GHVS01061297.1~~GHVS01061297.1.p1  ORF type:complete len:169 (+),score=10.48 GHVS01061297.1:175-681(+)